MTERLHHLLSRHHFLDEAVYARQRLLLSSEVAPRPRTEFCRCDGHQHGNEDTHEGKRYAEHNHRREGDDDGDERVEHLGHTRRNDLPQRIDIVGVGRHHLAVRMGVEVAQRQSFHTLKELLAQSQLSALRDVDHQPVVGIGADDAQQQHETEFEKGLQQRCILRVVNLRERHHVVVDERSCEERRCQRGDRRYGDARQHRQHQPLVVLHHQPKQSKQSRPLFLAHLLEACLSPWPRSSVSVEIRLPHYVD